MDRSEFRFETGQSDGLGLRDRVALQINLEAMRGLEVLLRLRINGPFHIAIFGFVDGPPEVEVGLAALLFPAMRTFSDPSWIHPSLDRLTPVSWGRDMRLDGCIQGRERTCSSGSRPCVDPSEV